MASILFYAELAICPHYFGLGFIAFDKLESGTAALPSSMLTTKDIKGLFVGVTEELH